MEICNDEETAENNLYQLHDSTQHYDYLGQEIKLSKRSSLRTSGEFSFSYEKIENAILEGSAS